MTRRYQAAPLILFFGFIAVFLTLELDTWASAAIAGEPGTVQEDAIQARKVAKKPRIDGILEEEPWQGPAIKKDFITYDPLFGEKLPQETEAWLAYDSKYLYFAFRCHDTEPEKIQTAITRRDNVLYDDWVSVSIDTAGSGQTAYVLYVNPHGIQADALVSSAASGEDIAPDFVWESAGRLTGKGYDVEIALPLKSISFKSGREVKMGVMFRRRINRLGFIGAWPAIGVGHSILDSQTRVVFQELSKQVRLEVLPSLTAVDNRERISPDRWGETDKSSGFGVGLKYGLTSSITADITINPDFSQVESDAFQVEVNQRYPLFYSEKRPFFMEGADIFKFYTLPTGFFTTPVHTRNILDPAWGAKVTGSLDKFSFGLLSAGDDWPGQSWDDGVNPNGGKQALFGVARGKYSLGKDSYVGFIYSGREFAGQYNRVAGADFGYWLGKNQRLNASFLHSFSAAADGNQSDAKKSSNANLEYAFNTKPFGLTAVFEHIGTQFQMDTAYIQRLGINNAILDLACNFYPDAQKTPWLKMVIPSTTFRYTHDLFSGKDDLYFGGYLYFVTTSEGLLILNYNYNREYWQGEEFNLQEFRLNFGLRLSKWFKIGGGYSYGDRIYYPAIPAFKGRGNYLVLYTTLQPNRKINQYFFFTYADLTRAGQKIYDINLLYSRTTYQFNKYFFLRAVVQYNSYLKRVLTDFLGSFTLIPGTVLHIGYGGLYEQRDWLDNQWLYRQGDMLDIKRSFFAKISYLWRF